MTLVDRKIVASVLSVRLYIQIWCTALSALVAHIWWENTGGGLGWVGRRRYLCGLKNWEEGGAPTDQTTTPSWRIRIYDSTYTGFYTILVRIWQMFTSWNDDPWPGFQKETFHSFEVEQGVAAGWLEDDTTSVIQCDDVQLYTFLSCTQFLEQCIALHCNGWGSLNQAQSWSPSISLLHFSVSRWRFSPGFYASVSFMIPCSIYFFFHSTDATYSNRSTFWSNLGARSVLFSFQPLHTFSWQAWVKLCKLDIT